MHTHRWRLASRLSTDFSGTKERMRRARVSGSVIRGSGSLHIPYDPQAALEPEAKKSFTGKNTSARSSRRTRMGFQTPIFSVRPRGSSQLRAGFQTPIFPVRPRGSSRARAGDLFFLWGT